MKKTWMLSRIGLWSAMRTGFLISAAVGLIMGLFWGMLFALFASLMASTASMRDPGFGPGAVIFMPLFGALLMGGIGSVIALLAALVYNLSAGVFGGLELELDARTGPEPAPSVSPAESGTVASPATVRGTMRRVWKRPSVGLVRQGAIHHRGTRQEPVEPDRSTVRSSPSNHENKEYPSIESMKEKE